jgi:hypothetical protein
MRPSRLLTLLICATLALAATTAPVFADIRILGSPGGEVGSFIKLFGEMRDTGERVIIDGPCYSACTLVLSTIPKERICVTRRAVLGFHGALLADRRGNIERAPASLNAAVAEVYPQPVQDWIARHGGLRKKMLTLRGAELYHYYPRCS